MNKFLSLVLVVALGVAVGLQALETTNGVGPSVGASGGTIYGGSGLQLGRNPGAQAPVVIPMLAKVNITQGDALVLVAGRGVSKTTTVCDLGFFGFATETTAFGDMCKVMRQGVFAVRIGTSTTVGDALAMSANPGFLTPTSACTGGIFTPMSKTAIAAIAFDTYTYVSYNPTVLIVR